MKQKKLNLGEILRKINEDAPGAPQSSPQPSPPFEQTPKNTGPLYTREIPPDHVGNRTPADAQEPPGNVAPPAREQRAPAAPEPLPATHSRDARASDPDPSFHRAGTHASQEPESGHAHRPVHAPHIKREGDDEEVEFDLFKYFGIIIHRKNIVLLATFIVALFSVFQYMKGEKIFSSHARLLFKPEEKEITGELVSSGLNRGNLFNTHLELLKSNTVLAIVADNLGNRVTPNQIVNNLSIAQGMTGREKNDIIEIGYRNQNPELARDVINELCKTYIDYRLEVNAQELTRLLYKFDVQISKLQVELSQKESDLRRFKESNRMIELSSEANLTSTKLSNMELAMQEAQLDLIQTKDKLNSLTSQIGKQDLTIVQAMTYSDPFRNKLSALELEYNTLSAENSPEHPKVKMIRQQIEKLKTAVADSIWQEASSKTLIKNPLRESLLSEYINLTIGQSSLEAKRIALEKIITDLNADLLKFPAIEQKYSFLQRETEAILSTLRLLKTKYEETKIKHDSQQTDIKILELADLPRSSTSTVQPISILLGLIIGLVLGIALAFFFEYLDQSVKDPLQIERILGMPLLGVVPLIETSNALLQKTGDLKKTILEPFRTLRANIKHLAATYNYHTFMICSAVKGEGKTTLAANLAITFALDGKKVILVDADLRRSQQHTLFSMPKETGLADYLLETKTVDEILKPTIYENLRLITSGDRPHNPAELIGTMRFDLLIQELRKRADIVLFDSPAILPVSDGLSMAPKMDGCVMVFRTMWTPLKAARQAKEQIARVGAPIIGGIFNGVSHSRGYYPYYYGYYGYYSYTKYSYEDEPKQKLSLRETGLLIENSIKKGLRSFRNTLPRYFGAAGSFLKALAKRRSFWILLAVFLGLSGIELWLQLRPAPERTDEEGIVYLGVGGAGQQASQNSSAMPIAPSDSQPGPSAAGTVTPGQPPATPLQTTGLQDSIRRWFAAKKSATISAYLNFYDSLEFKSVSGGYHELRRYARQNPRDSSVTNIVIDSIWQGLVKTPYLETMVRLQSANGPDTAHVTVNLLWKNGKNGWRIVGEKR